MTPTASNISELKKDSLILLAHQILSDKYPSFKFDSKEYEITAWSNNEKTLVKFRRIIRFTPLVKRDDNLDFDFEVDLTNRHTSFDTWGMDKFYIPTTEEQEKINFVIASFGLPRFGFNNSIVEDPDMYRITTSNKVAFGKYFIDKITGKECMGSIEGSYARKPDFPGLVNPDPLIEIKD